MKNAILIIVFCFSSLQFLHAQTRNTVWLGGLSQTSQGWGRTPEDLVQFYNYDLFNIISLQGLDNTAYQPDLGILGASVHLGGLIGNYPNLLGLGHDSGGLVLRALANGNNNLTAMVLDGVPNWGSSAIGFAINSSGPDGKTEAEYLIEGVKAIKSDENCEDCDLVGSFESWINDMKGNKELLSELVSNSPVINSLNQPAIMPQIPYAVFWGDMEELPITSLMSSRFFPGTGDADYFTACYAGALSRARKAANDKITVATLVGNVAGFFKNALDFVVKFVGENPLTNPLAILQASVDYLQTQKEEIQGQLDAMKERDQELARILRCEVANQLLATEWQFAMIRNGEINTEVTTGVPTYNECYDECMSGVSDPFEQQEAFYDCIPQCLEEITTTTVLVTEENDGLLNKSEQLLAGAEKTYHLESTNHFQETKLGNNHFADHIQDLFDGGAGPAFVVNHQ